MRRMAGGRVSRVGATRVGAGRTGVLRTSGVRGVTRLGIVRRSGVSMRRRSAARRSRARRSARAKSGSRVSRVRRWIRSSRRVSGPPERTGSTRRSTTRSPGRRTGWGVIVRVDGAADCAAACCACMLRTPGGRRPGFGGARRAESPVPGVNPACGVSRRVRSPLLPSLRPSLLPSRSWRSHRSWPVLPTGRMDEIVI